MTHAVVLTCCYVKQSSSSPFVTRPERSKKCHFKTVEVRHFCNCSWRTKDSLPLWSGFLSAPYRRRTLSSQNSYWDCYGSFDEQRLFSVKFARFRNFFRFCSDLGNSGIRQIVTNSMLTGRWWEGRILINLCGKKNVTNCDLLQSDFLLSVGPS